MVHIIRLLLLSVLSTLLISISYADAVFVSVDWMSKHHDDKNVIIVDSRTEEEYKKGHIKNAVNIPMRKTYKPTKNIYKMGGFKQIKKLFSDVGIEYDKQIIIYGDSSYFNSSRVFYVFEAYGHHELSILETGYPGWIKDELPISVSDTVVKKSHFIPIINPDRIISKFEMRLAIDDDNKVIIDGRPIEQFNGLKSITDRNGRIPSAINIPSTSNYEFSNGLRHVKSVEELKTLYSNIDKNKKIYLYCNEGLEASRNYSIMRKLGFDVAQYDGSWFEWGSDHKLPVEGPDNSD